MSAIGEWYGYQNAILLHILRNYGPEELDRCLRTLAADAYSDVIPVYREGGLPAIRQRYTENLTKDGDGHSVEACLQGETLTMHIRCPAFTHAPTETHPDRQCGEFYCQCCEKLEGAVLRNAGFSLQCSRERCGECVWTVRRAE